MQELACEKGEKLLKVTIPITEGWYQYYEYEDIINEDPAYRVLASELDTPKEAAKYVKTTQAYFYLHRIQADTDTEETE